MGIPEVRVPEMALELAIVIRFGQSKTEIL